MTPLYLCLGAIVAGGLLVAWQVVKKSKAPAEKKKAEQKKDSPDDSAKSDPAPKSPAPAPAVSARSYGWVWWLIIIIAIVFIGRWVWYERRSVKSTYSPPRVVAPQKFHIQIDPLSFNREKSRGVTVRKMDGGAIITVPPGVELVYEFELGDIPAKGHVSVEYKFGEINAQYMGYRVNDIRHDSVFITAGSGDARLGPELREFRKGKNEFALFSKGELRINGDEKIAIYQR